MESVRMGEMMYCVVSGCKEGCDCELGMNDYVGGGDRWSDCCHYGNCHGEERSVSGPSRTASDVGRRAMESDGIV